MPSFNDPISVYLAYKFVKLLSTPFEDWEAFKLGLIDKDGKKIKNPSTAQEKNSLTLMHTLIKNIKRVLMKFPFGKVKTVQFASALLLLKEEVGDEAFDLILDELETRYFLVADIDESTTSLLIEPGVYKVQYLDEIALVKINGNETPVDIILNHPVYRSNDIITGEPVTFTMNDIIQ